MNANEKERFLGCRNWSFIIRSSFKTPILFSSVHSGLSGPKKRKLGSILQMQLMEFHLLIEQSQKWEENGSTLSLTAKNKWVHFGKIVFKLEKDHHRSPDLLLAYLWKLVSAIEWKIKKVIATFYLTILTFFLTIASLHLAILTL